MPDFDRKLKTNWIVLKYLVILIFFVSASCLVFSYYNSSNHKKYAQQLQMWQNQIEKGNLSALPSELISRLYEIEKMNSVVLQLVSFGFLAAGVTLVFFKLNNKSLKAYSLLYKVLDSFTYPCYVLDANDDSTILIANKAALQTDNKIAESFPVLCRQKEWTDLIEKVRSTKTQLSVECIYTDTQNQQQMVEVNACPLFDQNDMYILVYIPDITRRKQTEEELRQRRENLHAIFEISPAGMILVDTTLKVRQVNQSFKQLPDKQIKPQIGGRIGDSLNCINAVDAANGCGSGTNCGACQLQKILTDTLKKGQITERKEIQCIFVIDGQEIELSFEVSAVPILLEAKRYALVVMNNITKRKQHEQQLHRARKEKESAWSEIDQLNRQLDASTQRVTFLAQEALDFSKVKSHFLKTLSQKIRSPINSILGLSELLAEEALSDSQKESVQLIQNSGNILLTLINDILDFSKIDAGKQQQDKTFIQFDVEDTGIGIAPDKQDKIFEPFTRKDDTTSQKHGGMGGGLTTSRKLAEMLGGELTVFSQPGAGSIFTLTIDAGPVGEENSGNNYKQNEEVQKQSDPKTKPIPTENSEVKKILLAEDNPINQQLMLVLLKKMSYKITLVENGKLAIDAMEKESFDIILMDIQMPEMNGLEATRIIRQKGFKNPILAITANALKGDREKCFEAGCDDYLAKPVDKDDLEEMINKYLQVAIA